jgi:hypothetical protein
MRSKKKRETVGVALTGQKSYKGVFRCKKNSEFC